MKIENYREFADFFLREWTSQEIDRVLNCYTSDMIYIDPNTRGEIRTKDNFSHYLKKLFANWNMEWHLRDIFPFHEKYGAAVLWRGVFRKNGSNRLIECNGMDFVLLRDEKICHNEVYFDRSLL